MNRLTSRRQPKGPDLRKRLPQTSEGGTRWKPKRLFTSSVSGQQFSHQSSALLTSLCVRWSGSVRWWSRERQYLVWPCGPPCPFPVSWGLICGHDGASTVSKSHPRVEESGATGTTFAIMYGTLICMNYFVQLRLLPRPFRRC